MKAFRDAKLGRWFLVMLDFFLSQGRECGTTIIPELECDHLICFSSMQQMSDSMYNIALGVERGRIGRVYSVRKLKETLLNEMLKEVLQRLFKPSWKSGERRGRERAPIRNLAFQNGGADRRRTCRARRRGSSEVTIPLVRACSSTLRSGAGRTAVANRALTRDRSTIDEVLFDGRPEQRVSES